MDTVSRGRRDSGDRTRSELLGLDFGTSGIKAVRLRRNRDQVALLAADILPPLAGPAPTSAAGITWPPALVSSYAALCTGSARSTVRLLDLPANPGLRIEDQIQQQFNLVGDYRLAHLPVTPPGLKGVVRTLAVALPEDETKLLLSLFVTGAPAPFSLEYSGVAALAGFLAGPGSPVADDAVCLLDAGAAFTHCFIVRQARPILIRRFDVGGTLVVDRIRTQFDLDGPTALNVLSSGAIDVSATYHEAMASLFKQLVISRDFIERREHCRVGSLWLTGGLSANPFWSTTLNEVMGLPTTVWNPLEGLAPAHADALPGRLRGQEPRFAAAVGAALGGILPS